MPLGDGQRDQEEASIWLGRPRMPCKLAANVPLGRHWSHRGPFALILAHRVDEHFLLKGKALLAVQ